ncbi:MAG: hypothetical protein ACRDQ7_03635 [Haloechinothrix sp.]
MKASGAVVLVIAATAFVSGAACGERVPPAGPGSPEPTTSAPNPSPPPGAETTLRGTVEAGVEAGCLVLSVNDKVYLLLGGEPRPRPGSRVEVTGQVDTDLMTTCQQGLPFVVTEVRPG